MSPYQLLVDHTVTLTRISQRLVRTLMLERKVKLTIKIMPFLENHETNKFAIQC